MATAGRRVLKRLLADRRLRVVPDAERGFRIEGSASWLLGGACEDRRVAGTRYVRSAARRGRIGAGASLSPSLPRST